MIKIEEHAHLRFHSAMRIGGTARYFAVAKTVDEVENAVSLSTNLGMPLIVLGSGSNMIWKEDELSCFVLKPDIRGFDVVKEDETSATITIGAGENWDDTVAKVVGIHLSGIEAMSAIPGTVGATPVQNVGAYGQEIKDTLVSLEAFDTKEKKIVTLTNADCRFRYRDSIFKSEEKGRYIILSVTLALSKLPPTVPAYPGVAKYFEEKGIGAPTLHDIRDAIIEIRKGKLPDPSIIPNCGSFFENPIVEKVLFDEIKSRFPEVKYFDLPDGRVKIPAGWLVEEAGFKDAMLGNGHIKVHDKNALVLTNGGDATFDDLLAAKEAIQKKVKEMFGIELEVEPNIIC